MNKLIVTAMAILFGTNIAFAQGGPGEKVRGGAPGKVEGPAAHGSPAHERGPAVAGPHGGGPGPVVQHRSEARREQHVEAQPSSKGDRASRATQPQQHAGDKASEKANSRAERSERPIRAYRDVEDKAKRTDDKDKAAKDTTSADRKADEAAKKGERGSDEASKKADRESSDAAKKADREGKGSHEATGGERKDARAVELSGDKRERVITAFREQGNVAHHTDAKIHLAIGTRLPRHWHLIPVPVAVVSIVPEYDGYLFAYVDDDYLICDPDTYEVVAILPASGANYARREPDGRCPAHLSLTEAERDLIVRSVRHNGRVEVSRLTIGWSVPRSVDLQEFPDPVIERASELGSCRYFVAEDQIAVVDPKEERVVLLIDRG